MNFKAGTQTGNEGLYWMSRILERDPTSCVVLITAYGDVELAVNALKEGATDFIQKSWDEEKILSSILSAYQKRKSKMKIKRLRSSQQHLTNQIDNRFPLVIGKSLAMIRFYCFKSFWNPEGSEFQLFYSGGQIEGERYCIEKRCLRFN